MNRRDQQDVTRLFLPLFRVTDGYSKDPNYQLECAKSSASLKLIGFRANGGLKVHSIPVIKE